MAFNFSSGIHGSTPARPVARDLAFAALWIGSLAAFHAPLAALVGLALSDERYTQIFLVPFLSGFLFWLRRERILTDSRYRREIGVPVLLGGVALGFVRGRWPERRRPSGSDFCDAPGLDRNCSIVLRYSVPSPERYFLYCFFF